MPTGILVLLGAAALLVPSILSIVRRCHSPGYRSAFLPVLFFALGMIALMVGIPMTWSHYSAKSNENQQKQQAE